MAWSILGPDLIAVVPLFLRNGSRCREIDDTYGFVLSTGMGSHVNDVLSAYVK